MSLETIDVHAHAVVPESLEQMRAAFPEHAPTLTGHGDAIRIVDPQRGTMGPVPAGMCDPVQRLAAMDARRIDRQVIAVPPAHLYYDVPVAVAVAFARILNDGLLELSDSHPDRIHVFATLPLGDVEVSLQELERIEAHRRVRGIQIGSNIGGTDLDHPRLEPLWDAVESRGLPIWVHPDQRSVAVADRLDRFYLQNLIGNPLESTIAIASLIFGGILERHPRIRFGFVHAGGFAPYQIGRWDHGWGCRPEPREKAHGHRPGDQLRKLYFDSLSHDAAALALLGRQVGWDRVMVGSDYPFDMGSRDPVGGIDAVGLDAADRDAILGGNAGRFLRPVDRGRR